MNNEEPAEEISVTALRDCLKKGPKPLLIDVRQPEEAAICALPDSHLIPLGDVPQRTGEIPRETAVVVYCHHGVRSLRAVHWLRERGWPKVQSLKGGIDGWALEVNPSMRRY